MRVALFRELPLTFQGGVTNVLRHLILQLRKAGHEALVFAPDENPGEREFLGARFIGVPFVHPPFFKTKKMPFAYYFDKKIDPVFADFKPDIVHLLHPMSLAWAAYTSARKMKLPVLASYHTNYHVYLEFYGMGFLSRFAWAYHRWIFNKSDRILAPSRSVKEMLDRGGMKGVRVWTRGVDAQLFSPAKRSEKLRREWTGGDPEKTVFLFVGRLYREKNIHFLIEHFRPNDKRRLVLVGDGPQRPEIEKKAAQKGIVLAGHLKGEELAAAYASADALLFPSTTEGYPNVVMEALASGLPVVGADAFGVRDILEESGAGLLYPPPDAAALNSRIDLFCDPAYRQLLSIRARRFAESRSWERMMGELFHHYAELTGKPAAPLLPVETPSPQLVSLGL